MKGNPFHLVYQHKAGCDEKFAKVINFNAVLRMFREINS